MAAAGDAAPQENLQEEEPDTMMEVLVEPSEEQVPKDKVDKEEPGSKMAVAAVLSEEQVPEDRLEKDCLEVIRECMANWLGEQKRIDNYRLVAREAEALMAQLRLAERSAKPIERPVPEDSGTKPSETTSPLTSASSRIGTELRLTVGTFRLRSVWHGERTEEAAQASLHITVQGSGGPAESLVEFFGRRAFDLSEDEAKYLVDHDIVRRLQKLWLPSLPSPVLLLDFILSLPIAQDSNAVPFRTRILEDMLHQECWDAESDSEILQELSICDEGLTEDVSRTYRSNCPTGEDPAVPKRRSRRRKEPTKGSVEEKDTQG